MKTLNTIQKLSRLGKILSRIVFIFCLVGVIGCALGLVGLGISAETFKIGGVTIHSLIDNSSGVSVDLAAVLTGLILCSGEAVLSKLAGRYFKNELNAGTPFTFDGAKELIRLGICTVCIPIGTRAAAEIVYQLTAHFYDVSDMKISGSVSVGLGIMMIVAGLLCRYGAEIMKEKDIYTERQGY